MVTAGLANDVEKAIKAIMSLSRALCDVTTSLCKRYYPGFTIYPPLAR